MPVFKKDEIGKDLYSKAILSYTMPFYYDHVDVTINKANKIDKVYAKIDLPE